MNARIYDPLLGRFLSPDPEVTDVERMQNYNRYAYVMNNPLSYTDPSGEAWYNDLGDFKEAVSKMFDGWGSKSSKAEPLAKFKQVMDNLAAYAADSRDLTAATRKANQLVSAGLEVKSIAGAAEYER